MLAFPYIPHYHTTQLYFHLLCLSPAFCTALSLSHCTAVMNSAGDLNPVSEEIKIFPLHSAEEPARLVEEC